MSSSDLPVILNSVFGAFDAEDPGSVALTLAAHGMNVFPLHTPQGVDGCSCGTACGRSAGKHPRTRHGLLEASTNPQVVAAWWTRWPAANVAVVTGVASGMLVLDIDPDQDGETTIAALEAQHGALAPTWAVETGGGGLHLWYRHTGTDVPCSVGKLGPGLDVRGDGGYVVVPPSRHRSGERYRWGEAWHPSKVPLVPAPPWLLALMSFLRAPRMIPPELVPLRERDGGNHFWGGIAAIPEGSRNAALTSLAGSMRRRGFGAAAIHAALQAENTERCSPPLPEAEVTKIAHSVARYAPDPGTAAPTRDSHFAGLRRGGFVEFVAGTAVRR